MRRFTGIFVLLAMSLVIAMSVTAVAAVQTVTYTQSLSGDDTILDWYQTITVPKFDTSTGYQLIGVKLEMVSDFTLTAGLENLAKAPSIMSYSLDIQMMLAWGSTGYIDHHITNYQESGIVVQGKDGNVNFEGPAGWQKTYDTETVAASNTVTAPVDLAAFSGTGNISLDASATTVSWLPSGTAGSKAAFYYAEMPTVIKVTYQYVPEPAGMIAMGTGLISLLGIAWKRRAII